jgi:hypothetical protein
LQVCVTWLGFNPMMMMMMSSQDAASPDLDISKTKGGELLASRTLLPPARWEIETRTHTPTRTPHAQPPLSLASSPSSLLPPTGHACWKDVVPRLPRRSSTWSCGRRVCTGPVVHLISRQVAANGAICSRALPCLALKGLGGQRFQWPGAPF